MAWGSAQPDQPAVVGRLDLEDLLTLVTTSEARLSVLAVQASTTVDRRTIMAEYDNVFAAVTRIRQQIREGF